MKILFVCTANICRSVMAEAIIKDLLSHTDQAQSVEAASAGIEAFVGVAPDETTQQVCSERRIDVSAHRARQLTAGMVDDADLVLCLAQNHKRLILGAYPRFKGKVSLLKEFRREDAAGNLSVEDPVGKSRRHYAACFREIEKEVTRIVPLILEKKS